MYKIYNKQELIDRGLLGCIDIIINQAYEEGNGEVWGYHIYKGKPVFLHYCKDKDGNWVR